MIRLIRLGLSLMLVFGLMWLLQSLGLDQGTAITLISITFVTLALLVLATLKTKKLSGSDNNSL